jgi:hypothetical protein
LEKQLQAKDDTGCALYNAQGNEVEAEIITIPEHEVEGLAELPGGKRIPVVYDVYAIRLSLPEEPQLDENKLYYRWRPGAEPTGTPGNIKVHWPEGLCVEDII